MPFGLSLNVTNRLTPTLGVVARGLAPERLGPVIGRSAVGVWRGHLFGLNRNRPNVLGGRRTGFYAQAARSANFRVETDGSVIVSVNSVGIAQRYFGGTIRPKPGKKFLTIPVAPEAYGKTAREFGRLVLVFGQNGRPIALATPVSNVTKFTKKRGSQERVGKSLGQRAGTILFRLVTSVTQSPDATVLPPGAEFDAKIAADLDAYTARLLERAGQNGGPAA